MTEHDEHHDEGRVVVNDKRRIDPATGQVRSGFGSQSPFPSAPKPGDPEQAAQPITATVADAAELEAAKQEAAERTADLQRITAEYANYRKRMDRDREQAREAGKVAVLGELLTVLDDLDRAESHGDLTGPFKAVGERLTSTLDRLGLHRFGSVGDEFDPSHHEAVHFDTSPDVTGQVVSAVMRPGYSVGDRLVRPAVVGVTGPEIHSEPSGDGSAAPNAAAPDAAAPNAEN